jgi:hypothetical protein
VLALWAASWAMSFYAYATNAPTGDGFVRGLNRVTAFLGWQLAAAVPAFAAWILGRDWPRGTGVRIVSRMPIQLALALAVALGGILLVVRIAA